jgi:D-aminopeptidase
VRTRDLGIVIGNMPPGRHNAITDVPGVRVGHTTLIEGEGPLVVGKGPVRTGVTVIVPHEGRVGEEPLFAGCHRLNGNGELTGLEWIRESGLLTSLIALTNTHSVGIVRDALIAFDVREHGPERVRWSLPVVGETWDGVLNDVNGQHVRAEHVERAIRECSGGEVAEGNVGGGTGMTCHGFKGGIGTASRVLSSSAGGYTVGVLIQANHGRRERLRVNGTAVGEALPASVVPLPGDPAMGQETGSVIVVVATDAPLLPNQCARVAQRAGLGIARAGGAGEHTSGDLFLAFSVGNRGAHSAGAQDPPQVTSQIEMLSNAYITELFYAVVEATEEAIINALLGAQTMAGRDGLVAHALDPDRLTEILSL